MSDVKILAPGITSTLGVRGGRPCIEGAGIRVTDIETAMKFGECTSAEVAEELAISDQQVDAALRYYARNRTYIDADIQHQFDTFEKLAEVGYGRPAAKVLSR